MLVQIEDMQSVIDQYKLDQITDTTEAITTICIKAAENRLFSYLESRYNVAKIKSLNPNDERLADIKEMIKDMALYLIMRRHNIDIAYERVVDNYKMHLEYLKQVAEGKVKLTGLPLAINQDGSTRVTLEMGSRPKRDFQF